jgi:hypothetical protein
MRRLVVTSLAIATLWACGDNSSTGTVNAADAGNYVLRTINDTIMPYTLVNSSTAQLSVLADTIFMGVDGHFTDRTYQKLVQNGVTTLPVNVTDGTWSEKGATVVFNGNDGSVITASFQGSSLVILGSNLRAVYTR